MLSPRLELGVSSAREGLSDEYELYDSLKLILRQPSLICRHRILLGRIQNDVAERIY
jgi:hypothetical protein